jgi:hypothetical protein
MKTKIGIAIACLSCVFHSVRAQIFNDPLHMASNLMEFIESIDASIQSVEGVERVWNAGKQTTEHLKALKETVIAINRMLFDMQEVEFAIRDLIEMEKMFVETTKLLINAHNIATHEEAIMTLNAFTATVTRATRNLVTITDYLSEDKWKMTDEERKRSIFEKREEIAKDKAKMEEAMEVVEEVVELCLLQDQLIDNYCNETMSGSAMSMADLYALITARQEKERSGMEELFVTGSEFLGSKNSNKKKKESATAATSKVVGTAQDFFTLYYCICGIIGLIGAYKVYSKVQYGEDFGKAAGMSGQTHLNLLGFSKDNRYPIPHPAFFL